MSSQQTVVSSVERLAFRVRLERMYKRYDPSRVHHVDALLAKFERHEEEMMKALVAKYGPEPDASVVNIQVVPCRERFKKRIYNFYKFYNPEKLGMVDDVADGYWQSGEAEIMANLIAKYGPEPMVHTDGTTRMAPKRHRGLAVSQVDPSRPAPPSGGSPTATTTTSDIVGSREGSPVAAGGSPSPTSAPDATSTSQRVMEPQETDMDDIEAFLKGATISLASPKVPAVANRDELL